MVTSASELPRLRCAISLQCMRSSRRHRLSTHTTSSSRFRRIRRSYLLIHATSYGNHTPWHLCTAPKVGRRAYAEPQSAPAVSVTRDATTGHPLCIHSVYYCRCVKLSRAGRLDRVIADLMQSSVADRVRSSNHSVTFTLHTVSSVCLISPRVRCHHALAVELPPRSLHASPHSRQSRAMTASSLGFAGVRSSRSLSGHSLLV